MTMTEPEPEPITLADLEARGIPVVRFPVPDVYKDLHVLETRRERRRHRRHTRRQAYRRRVELRVAHNHHERIYVRSWRQQYPWHVRYPNLGHVVFWSMVLIGVALFIFA